MTMKFKEATIFALLTLITVPAIGHAAQATVNIAVPAITCVNQEESHECDLSGELMVRGPESLAGPIKYYCDVRYRYIAAGNDTGSIRFDGRMIKRGEVNLTNGRTRQSLSEPIQLNLPKKAKNVTLTSVACDVE